MRQSPRVESWKTSLEQQPLLSQRQKPRHAHRLKKVDTNGGQKDSRARDGVDTNQDVTYMIPLLSLLLQKQQMEYEKGQAAWVTYLSHKVRHIYFDIKHKHKAASPPYSLEQGLCV